MESSRPAKSARAMRESLERESRGPRILCWNCKEMTPYHADRCESCGAPFAGSTGGAFGANRRRAAKPPAARDPAARISPPRAAAPRSSSRPPSSRAVATKSVAMMQEELAEARRSLTQLVDDLQRVHDASSPDARSEPGEDQILLFQCPACGRFVSEAATACSCGVRFAPAQASSEPLYQCGHCGSEVSGDAVRCSCGALFKT